MAEPTEEPKVETKEEVGGAPSGYQEEKELLSWRAVQRPYQVKSKEFYSTVVVLAILVGIIFFFIEGIMPVLVVAAILFAVLVSSRTPPVEVENVITDKGVGVGKDKFTWDELLMFWTASQGGVKVVNFITARRWPRQLILVLPAGDERVTEDKVRQILLKYLPMQQLPPSTLDKMVRWIGEKIPLEG